MNNIVALDNLRKLASDFQSDVYKRDEADYVLEIADEIEREISERYMLLPVDMDNEPICMGDSVEGELLDDSTVSGTVCAFHLYDDEPDSVYIKISVQGGWTIKELRLTSCRHVKHRTLEDVLLEFGNEVKRDCYSIDIEKYADEIRKLMGGDGQ